MLVDSLKNFKSKLITKFRKIHTQCLTLLKKLLLFFKKDQNDSKNESKLIIINDKLHKQSIVLNYINKRYI